MKDELNKEWLSYIRHKRFRPSTISTYTSSVEWYLSKCGENIKDMTYHEIRTILLQVDNKNTVNSTITAVRQFYLHVFGRELDWKQLPYVKKSIKIQPIYTPEEINKVINAITNEKQKAIIALIADQGLRISEPCSILLSDVYFNDKIIIRSAKGDKDRLIFPSESAWALINNYLDIWDNKPINYLFEGQKRGEPYTPESIRETVIRYCNKTGIVYKGVHAIRRMTGTWSVENGIPETVTARKLGNTVKTLHKHYLIHSESYLKNIPTPLSCNR